MTFGVFDIQQWEKARQSDVNTKATSTDREGGHAALGECQANAVMVNAVDEFTFCVKL